MGGESSKEKKARLEREAAEAERRRQERIRQEKLNDIDSFKNSQDIPTFLNLINRFIRNYDDYYAILTLKALKEEEIIRNYPSIRKASEENIGIIKNSIFKKFKESLDEDCLRKLLIILMFYERETSYNGINNLYKECSEEGLKKNLLYILLQYSDTFGNDINFEYTYSNYKNFANYSLNQGYQYYFFNSLKYCKNNIWQLRMVNDLKSTIFNKINDDIFFYRFDYYDDAKELIQEIIRYEKSQNKYLVKFPQNFWENYYNNVFNAYSSNIKYKIQNLLDVYNLFVLYIDVGGEKNYKYKLAEKIHSYVQKNIKDTSDARTQLELLLEYDPYYLFGEYSKDPDIFRFINILNLYKKQNDIDYFKRKDFENIYKNAFKEYIEIIVSNYINNAQNLNIILELIEINATENKRKYIVLLIDKYYSFKCEKLTCESFMNLLKKVIAYYSGKKIDFLDKILPKFQQNYQIYLDILEVYDKDTEIMEKIGKISYNKLKVDNLIRLIKNIKLNEKKNVYFNNLKGDAIEYEQFFIRDEDESKNKTLKLLIELVKNELIPFNNIYQKDKEKCFSTDNSYLVETQKTLDNLNENLLTFKEKKKTYLNTILNENNKEIQKIFKKRFNLFKVVKGSNFNGEKKAEDLREKYYKVEEYIKKAKKITELLILFFRKTKEKDINEIYKLYKWYLDKESVVEKWIIKESYFDEYIRDYYSHNTKLIETLKEIELFKVIYSKFTEEEDEKSKYEEALEKFNECKTIFIDINKADRKILETWQKELGDEKNKELEKLENYYKENCELKIKDNKNISKNIMIFTKKNIYKKDIEYYLYFIDIFNVEKTDLSNILIEKQKVFEDEKNVNFDQLNDINDYMEKIEIYINDGKDDSPLIKLMKALNGNKDKIIFAKGKDVDSAAALIYRINPTADSLKFKDILEYQNCVDFIQDIKDKKTDNELLLAVKTRLEKDNIDIVLASFTNYFHTYESIKKLDTNYDGSDEIYQSIVAVLNNSKYKIELFKRKFDIYEDEKDKDEKKIKIKDLKGLIELKDNITLNFEELPDNIKLKDKDEEKKKLEEKKKKITIFKQYIERLQTIIKLFTRLENKGLPFLISIKIIALNDSITYELVENKLEYNELIVKLKQYCDAMEIYQKRFYKENVYFRFIYEKQLYRIYKKITNRDKDISSYIRYFTNGDSINDDFPNFKKVFNDPSLAYINYKISIESNFENISKYIQHIFKINNTSLEKLYNGIKIDKSKDLKGIYKCKIEKSKIDIFIINMFFSLTGGFPIAQNLLLTNNETSSGEITSFMYRALKCEFNTLFIISLNEDISSKNINYMTNLLDEITNSMRNESNKKSSTDEKPCILFVTSATSNKSKGLLVRPDINDLSEDFIKKTLEFNIENEDSFQGSKSLNKSQFAKNEIYNRIKIFTSDCCGLGKSELIKKQIEKDGKEYYYFGIGDDITKNDIFKKLKKMLKYDIKGKFNVGLHLDLFYTKNIPLMQYFLFSVLITKLYQVTNNIIYIPKDICIYVEVPNGPQNFIDEFPILKLFHRTSIELNAQTSLDIQDENLAKKLTWDKNKKNSNEIEDIIGLNEYKNNPMIYIEKQIYMNIISSLCPDNLELKDKYYDKVKSAANCFTKSVYSEKIRIRDQVQENKRPEDIKEYVFDFLKFDEGKALDIQYKVPLIFKTNNNYEEINISDEELKDKDLNYFLTNLKKIMNLNLSIKDIEEKMFGQYKITKDNYKKMILILFRIYSNIPVILMGETGCGKTELVKQLMKAMNNVTNENEEKKLKDYLIIKNMHSGVKESEIQQVIDEAELKSKNSKDKLICIFFDEINTTSLLSKMKEIFVNHSLNGKKISENIRFIGACNPFRKKSPKENDIGLRLNENAEEMTYLVNPLPNSLLNYIFYFKSLEDDDVKEYIESIMDGDNLFKKENESFRKIVNEAIFESHKYVREKNDESSVSLRDLQRFRLAYRFFDKYFKYKIKFKNKDNEEVNEIDEKSKIRSIALSLFITYYIRILKDEEKIDYVSKINEKLKSLSSHFKIDNNDWDKDDDDKNLIKFEKNAFTILIKEEQKFIINEMEIQKVKGIGINDSLKQNIFLMFFSIYTHIPLIVVGKPGCSKSLSIQLIIRLMRGEFSKSNFLKNYPSINNTGFQGSETNTPESIEKIFKIAEEKLMDKTEEINIDGKSKKNNKKDMISLLVFDELGLSEKSPTNCLKVLHSKLEISLNPKDENKISFIGISNWKLDAAKMNRTIFLAIPEIEIDDITLTAEAIAKSYDPKLYDENEYQKELYFLGYAFYKYKKTLNRQNEFEQNYHGGRDFYHLIKNFSSEMIKNGKPKDNDSIIRAMKYSLARNLNGLEIDGDNQLKKFLKELKNDDKIDQQDYKEINLDDINEIDLIIDNITSKDCRFLLLISEKSMFDFLVNIIKKKLNELNEHSEDKKQYNYVNYIGSPFKGDMFNISYQTQMISSIENSVAEGKIIILSNLEQIYSIFYDLFNQNYIEKDKKKFCRVSHGANIQKLAYVNDNTKFIILVDENDLKKQKLPFLSRFEKLIIKFENILSIEDKDNSKKINDLLSKIVDIKGKYYDMDSLLVNTNQNIINGYVSLYQGNENLYDDIIEEKIIPILPQDIIFSLPFSKLSEENNEMDNIKRNYMKKSYKSLNEYLNSTNRGKEEILMVYTFSKIEDAINFFAKIKEAYMEIIVSEIKTANKFEHILKEFYEQNKNILSLKFNSENTIYINFFISEINHYKISNNIHTNDKKFIFIINIKRYFNLENPKKITTALIVDDNINQLFIDNLNGSELSVEEIEGKEISDYIKEGLLDPKKYIIEGMLNFYEKHINEQMGKYKGISYDNFKKEFLNYIKKNEAIIEDIKKIILKQIGNSENLVNLIIKNKFIEQNTIDFISTIITYIKDIFNKKLEFILKESESNNFFITYFMLNFKEEEESKINDISSEKELNLYSFNINDEQLINNKIFNGIKGKYLEYLRNLKEDKNNIDNSKIEIKVYYKIPAFFNIYKHISLFIKNEKISRIYKQNEREVRKCVFEIDSVEKLKSVKEEFAVKLFTELTSNDFVAETLKDKYSYDNYIQFIETFLNDYITFYLVQKYKNISKFKINDAPHKIILILLDLKFKELDDKNKDKNKDKTENSKENNDNQQNKYFKNVISKILWLEANSDNIKLILDLYNEISENILFDEKENEILLKEIIKYILENKVKYEPIKEDLLEVNTPFYIIIIILINCLLDKKSISIAASKGDNYNYYFQHIEIYLKEMQKLDMILKLDIKEISVLNELFIIYSDYERLGKLDNMDINKLIDIIIGSLEILKRKDENKIKALCENLKSLIEYIKDSLYDTSKKDELKGDENYNKLISNIFLNEIQRENSKEFKLFILEEFLLKDEKLFIQSLKLLIIILEDYVNPNVYFFQGSFKTLSDKNLESLGIMMKKNDWINETILYVFEQISIIYIENLIFDNEKIKDEKKKKILLLI